MSDKAPEERNPYDSRNHEGNGIQNRDDVLAVAGLLGQVTGSLGEIDKQQVGSDSQFIRAKKIDPKAALQTIVNSGTPAHPPPPEVHQPIPIPPAAPPKPLSNEDMAYAPPVPPVPTAPEATADNIKDLENRITDLESTINSYKKILKFKRGISYTVNTVNIKGEFRSPSDILDVISSEMAKQTKTITLKLNDTNKPKR